MYTGKLFVSFLESGLTFVLTVKPDSRKDTAGERAQAFSELDLRIDESVETFVRFMVVERNENIEIISSVPIETSDAFTISFQNIKGQIGPYIPATSLGYRGFVRL